MTTVYVGVDQAVGTTTVVNAPNSGAFQVVAPDTILEVSSAQLNCIVQAGAALLGVSNVAQVKAAYYGDSNFLIRPGVTDTQTFPALMSAALNAGSSSVFAVAGEPSGSLLLRQAAVRSFKPTIVFLDSMINDISAQTASDVYETNLRTMITNHLIDGAKVVLMSSIFWAATTFLERQRDIYMPIWRRLSRMPGVVSVDCYTRMAAMTMQSSRADFDALTVDVQHWSAAGNAKRVLWCKEALGMV